MDRERTSPAKRNADTNDDHRGKRNFPRNPFSCATASISLCINIPAVYFAILRKIWTATLDSGYLEILILKPKIIFHTLFSQGFVGVCFRLSIFPCPLLYARAISSSRWNDDNGNAQRITVRVVSPDKLYIPYHYYYSFITIIIIVINKEIPSAVTLISCWQRRVGRMIASRYYHCLLVFLSPK